MTRIALPIGALAVISVAVAVSRHASEKPGHTAGLHGLQGWSPPKITDEKQEKKDIEALLEEMHAAYRNGDRAAAAARIQFPILMITDDWKGEVLARSWDRGTWMLAMAPLFDHPAHEMQREHQHNIFVMSDSLASVQDEQSVTIGKKKVTIRSSSILVKKDRGWFVQATVEGGWGNTPIARPVMPAAMAPALGTGVSAESDGEAQGVEK